MSFIETERLILRTWMDSDVGALCEMDGARTRDDARVWIEHASEEQDREGFSLWPVIRKSDGKLIGWCGLHRHDDGRVEIAWTLQHEARGHGFGSEAARAVLDYATGVLRLRELFALADPRDRASVALANRLGMRFDRMVRAGGREVLRYVI